MLYMLGADELARTLLPIGEMTKAEVRARAHDARAAHRRQAREHGRLLHHARRARGVPRRAHRAPARARSSTPRARSSARTTASTRSRSGSGAVLGVAVGERRYVVDIAPATATVTVGPRDALLRDRVQLRDLTFRPRAPPRDVLAQTRAHGAPVPAALDGDTWCSRRRSARVAPGQVVACLRRRRVLRRRHRRRLSRRRHARRDAAVSPCCGVTNARRRAPPTPARCRVLDELGVAAAPPASERLRLAPASQIVPAAAAQPQVERAGARSARRRDRPTRAICSRRMSTGSASVSGSATTTPAGTSTSQRRASGVQRARPSRTRAGTRRTTTTTPATTRPSASSNGPTATPPPINRTASGTGPSSSDGGVRSGKRTSSPYAIALAAAARDRRRQREHGRDEALTTRETADAAVVLVTTRATRDDRGGRDDAQHGETPGPRGEQRDQPDRPRRPQATPSATRAGRVDHSSSASPSAAPTDTGSNAHASRASTPTSGRSRALRFVRHAAGVLSYESSCPITSSCPGMATAIGSLPHRDADAAAALVLRCVPELPAAPQLPLRTPLEGFVAQWARAIDGVDVERRRHARRCAAVRRTRAAIDTTFDPIAHGGLLAFLDVAAAQPRAAQAREGAVRGPADARRRARRGRRRRPTSRSGSARRTARAWARALQELVATRLPDAAVVVCFDEPALVRWQRAAPRPARPRDRNRHPVDRPGGAGVPHGRARVRPRRPAPRARRRPTPRPLRHRRARPRRRRRRSRGSSRAAAG